MALESLTAWVDRLLQNSQVDTPSAGAWNLANFYGDKADLVQAVPGTAGIFTFNRALFVSELLSLGFDPVDDTSWASKIATAWQTAVAGSSIAAGTVTDAAWTLSVVDSNTAGTGAAVIVTLANAKDSLESSLLSLGSNYVNDLITNESENNTQVEAFAKAWRDATLIFEFECIGLAGPPPVQIPIVFPSI